MILIKVKNPNLLDSVRDYCNENLLHELMVQECGPDDVDDIVATFDKAIVVTDGTVFYDHLDEDFLKNITDINECKQIGSGSVFVRNNEAVSNETRDFFDHEYKQFKFLGNTKKEQTENLLQFDKVPAKSFYYPLATSKPKYFEKDYMNYISVANGVESLQRISKVYKNINEISFYDISITALLFTELFIKSYNGNYRNFVEVFDKAGGRKWTTLDVDSDDMYAPLVDPDIMPILEHIRTNCKVKYHIGDITRPNILDKIRITHSKSQDTLFNLSNVFEYAHNTLRKEDKDYWYGKLPTNVEVLT